MACFVYEGVLLFGVVVVVGLLYGVLVNQRHALQGRPGLIAANFLAIGVYFVWFWSHGGQTLPMQTWRMRLVTAGGARVTAPRAAARYLLSYLWFLPALATLWATGLSRNATAVSLVLAGGVLAYAALAWLHPQRQFWHDAVCGTRLVDWQNRPARPPT